MLLQRRQLLPFPRCVGMLVVVRLLEPRMIPSSSRMIYFLMFSVQRTDDQRYSTVPYSMSYYGIVPVADLSIEKSECFQPSILWCIVQHCRHWYHRVPYPTYYVEYVCRSTYTGHCRYGYYTIIGIEFNRIEFIQHQSLSFFFLTVNTHKVICELEIHY